jgi:hypothetical protein
MLIMLRMNTMMPSWKRMGTTIAFLTAWFSYEDFNDELTPLVDLYNGQNCFHHGFQDD